MIKDIYNFNSKGQLHGYCEWYRNSGDLLVKRYYYNAIAIDYEEYYCYYSWGGELVKSFFI